VSRQTPVIASTGPGGWTAQGGTFVTIGPGENINVIANRYGVPASAILSANKLSNASQAVPGRQVVIPVYNAAGTQSAATQPRAPLGQGRLRLAETAKSVPAKQAELPKQPIRPGPTLAKAEPFSAPRPLEPIKTAKAEMQPIPEPKAWAPQPAAPAPKQEAVQTAKEPEQTASLPTGAGADFRWPARGRVISGFGGSAGNEGINIALPEGTPVKAAESGTVAYAGSEVKGYGNLILVRHDNGFVSAYAHNGEISVKRGDKVRRGQVIAKSGQTGNVTSPQLHFEIRKGSTPVDPIPHLQGN
jgi:murein DD-endopeptidase MepM/ murein hydrolase activator NlpD